MNKNRLEAFSDGVLAIVITIMVLELEVPHGSDFASLKPLVPIALSYVLSFLYIAIYWNNHHHLYHTVTEVSGAMLWANMHLLFWLSLIPFATAWMGENHFAPNTLALYGVVLLMCAFGYYILKTVIIKFQGKKSVLAKALGKDLKGKISPLFYVIGIGLSFYSVWLSGMAYVIVALVWLIPDKRIETFIEIN